MALRPLQIGKHTIANPLFLAPMAGVSDAPFREVCSAQGAGLTVAEMLTSNIEHWSSDKNRLRLVKPDLPGPQMIQIAGSDPGLMSEAAIVNVAMGADIIDINMGCPAKKVLQKAAGSALLKDPQLVDTILRAVVASVDVPVTLKIRTGWCPDNRNGVEIARIAEQAGIRLLTVHGRTRACRFRGEAEYDTIAAIRQAVGIPVIANGDICSPSKAQRVLDRTGADGLMIGRGAQGRPWLFRQISGYLESGRAAPDPGIDEIQAVMESHVRKIHACYGPRKGVLFARKHVNWYCRSLAAWTTTALPCPRRMWQQFSSHQCADGQLHELRMYFQSLHNNNTREIAA